jgi:hypothetical protein
MLTKEQLQTLDSAFKRILVLPISKMTIRELQDVLNNFLDGSKDVPRNLFNSIVEGKVNPAFDKSIHKEIQDFIDKYSATFRVAIDVADTGEFINSFTCDQIVQNNRPFYVNRMRRIDGEEYYFISNPDTTIRLAQMFVKRLIETRKETKNLPLEPRVKKELESIRKDLESLLN